MLVGKASAMRLPPDSCQGDSKTGFHQPLIRQLLGGVRHSSGKRPEEADSCQPALSLLPVCLTLTLPPAVISLGKRTPQYPHAVHPWKVLESVF